tara:strand:+ start:1607 stop:2356 length:750 start_codon:yes stop_codon:yes gene_type:complete
MFRVAIASYKRSDTIKDKTLHYLIDQCSVSPEMIDVFVQEDQVSDYKESLAELRVNVLLGAPGMKGQRNAIDMHYEKGQKVLCFDDDVEGLYKRENEKKVTLFKNLKGLAAIGFNECAKNRTALFGVSPLSNPFYMNNKITNNLKFICGPFYGQIMQKDPSLLTTVEYKTDFERSLKYFYKFGSVVRLNMFGPKTAYYKEKGGLQGIRTKEIENKSAATLIARYPNNVRVNKNRKDDGRVQIILHGKRC